MNPPKIFFGSGEVTSILDDNGSTATASIDYKAGKPKLPIRRHYKIRERVHSQAEEQEKYLQFSDELKSNHLLLDPLWLPKERSKDGDQNGYYYVVKCYTLLEY